MATLDGVRAAIELLDRFHEELGGSREDRLNFSALIVSATVAEVPVDRLYQLSDSGSNATLVVTAGDFKVTIEVRDHRRFSSVVESDRFEDAFDGGDLAAARSALASNSIEEFLLLAASLKCTARLVVASDGPTLDAAWVRTQQALYADSEDEGWWHFAVTLCGAGRPGTIVVLDAGAAYIRCHGLMLRGPDVVRDAEPAGDGAGWISYRTSWLKDERSILPPPIAMKPLDHLGLDQITERLNTLVCAISWTWLAQWSKPTTKGAKLGFEGRPPIELDMTNWPATDGCEEAFELVTWVTHASDLTRRDAVGLALLAVVADNGILRSARRILETAQLLLRESQQAILAEALRARRDAVAATRDAAYKGADTVRAATKAATDRAFTELAAAAGIVLANLTSTLNPDLSHALLILVGVLVAITAGVAFFYDFPSAKHYLETLDADLNLYSDSITAADLERVKSMAALAAVKGELNRAMGFVGVILVMLAVATIGGFAVVH